MIRWTAEIKEKANDHILTPEYLVPEDGMHDYIDENFLINFWGLDHKDVEWYNLHKVNE